MTLRPIHSSSSHSFDTGIAKMLGVHAAVIFNHIYQLRNTNCSADYFFSLVSAFISKKEFEKALKNLESYNFIEISKSNERISLCDEVQ